MSKEETLCHVRLLLLSRYLARADGRCPGEAITKTAAVVFEETTDPDLKMLAKILKGPLKPKRFAGRLYNEVQQKVRSVMQLQTGYYWEVTDGKS